MVAQKSLTEFKLDQEVVLSACLFVLHKEGQKEHNERAITPKYELMKKSEVAEVSGVKSESIQFNRPQIL